MLSLHNRRSYNPQMIAVARESRGVTQTQLATKLDVSQALISKIENGLLPVPDELAMRIAGVLEYEIDLLRWQDPLYGIQKSILYHRRRQRTPKKILDKIHALLNIRRMQIQRMLEDVEPDRPDRFEHYDIDAYDGDAEQIARLIRASWLLPRGPIQNLLHAVENAGGIVIVCDFETPLIDAISQWVPDMPPLFFVNTTAPGDRLRFSLAHELGHVLMHRLPNAEMEDQADRFAAELLMPSDEIRPMLYGLTLAKLAALKPQWKVSMNALLKRAGDLQTISTSTSSGLWKQMSRLGYRTSEPPGIEIPRERPQLIGKLIDVFLSDLEYTTSELSRTLGITATEFRATFLGDVPRLRAIQ